MTPAFSKEEFAIGGWLSWLIDGVAVIREDRRCGTGRRIDIRYIRESCRKQQSDTSES